MATVPTETLAENAVDADDHNGAAEVGNTFYFSSFLQQRSHDEGGQSDEVSALPTMSMPASFAPSDFGFDMEPASMRASGSRARSCSVLQASEALHNLQQRSPSTIVQRLSASGVARSSAASFAASAESCVTTAAGVAAQAANVFVDNVAPIAEPATERAAESAAATLDLAVAVLSWCENRATSSSFVEYIIDVANGQLSWIVRRRFTEFEKLANSMESLFGASASPPRLPELPGKLYGNHSPERLERRKDELHSYLQQLLLVPDVSTSAPFMVFIGILNENSFEDGRDAGRRKVHIDKAMKLLEPGDLILFKTNFTLSALQRSLTFSEVDHAALVVRSTLKSNSPATLHLLEATGDGVRTYNLKKRLLAWHEVKAEMCFRKLNMSRAPEAGYVQKLIEFVEKVDGLEYNLSVMDIVSRKSIAVEKRKAYFCSELVAAAYKHIGVISSDRPANSYFPGSLVSDQDASLGLIDGITLAAEVDLIFRFPEVADAAQRE